MPKKRYTAEEIIQHLRTVELDTRQRPGRARLLPEGRHHRARCV